jgi:hypothetical protein
MAPALAFYPLDYGLPGRGTGHQMAKKKAKRYSATKEVKAIARERIGPVPPAQTIQPKTQRKKPKHKQDLLKDPAAADAT